MVGTVSVEASKYGLPSEEMLEALKIKLAAQPVDGEANQELIRFLAKHYKVAKSDLQIIKGEKSKYKVVEIAKTASAQSLFY